MSKQKTSTAHEDVRTTEIPPSYNLWVEPWITLERPTGALEQHGIAYTLLHAQEFKAIYDPSPLVIVGIHRLLTAVLQDALVPQSEDELRDLWEANAFPIDKIQQFGDGCADRFDLFSLDKPFMQSADLPLAPTKDDNIKFVASLFSEVPSGTEVTHYNHGVESDQLYSPAAAAAGIVIVPAFASPGGQGIKPSINGVPPIYVLPYGRSCFEMLCASLLIPQFRPTMASHKRDDVWWRREPLIPRGAEVIEVGYLHSLTFAARRIRLHPEKIEAICTRTGRYTEWGVRTMIFDMGESRPKDAPFWQDPFAAYRLPAIKQPSKRAKPGPQTKKKDQPVPVRPLPGKATWREFNTLFLQRHDDARHTERPRVIEQMAELELAGSQQLYPYRCVGILTNMQAKNFEWIDFGFDVPPSLLNNQRDAIQVDKAISLANDCGSIIMSVFARHFAGTSRKTERHRTIQERMMQTYWASLGASFRSFILGLAVEESQGAGYRVWVSTVIDTANNVFTQAAESIGDDAANLRKRTEGEQHCFYRLNDRRRKELPNE